MQVKISEIEQALIDELRTRQDYHAFSLGVLEAEYQGKLRVLLDAVPSETHQKLGALVWDHHQKELFWFSKISETEASQKAAGEQALRAVGVAPDSGEYQIVNQIVHVLTTGVWVPLER